VEDEVLRYILISLKINPLRRPVTAFAGFGLANTLYARLKGVPCRAVYRRND